MKYINTKSKVTLETDNTVSGGDWILIDDLKKEVKEETKEEVKEVKEVKEEPELTLNDITIPEIKNELDALGVEYDNRAKKDELWKLLEENM